MSINWDSPEERAALEKRVGPLAYNTAFAAYLKQIPLSRVGGHDIRPLGSRFNLVFQVGNTGRTFGSQAEAEAYAAAAPPIQVI